MKHFIINYCSSYYSQQYILQLPLGYLYDSYLMWDFRRKLDNKLDSDKL